MSSLQKISSISDPSSLDGQLLIEAEFQKYFKKTPPLVITKAEIDQLITALDDIFKHKKNFLSLAMATGKELLKK